MAFHNSMESQQSKGEELLQNFFKKYKQNTNEKQQIQVNNNILARST